MTIQEVKDILHRAKPICSTEDFVVSEHNKAVAKAKKLIKSAGDPFLMTVLSERYLEGNSVKEVAYELRCSKTTVNRLLNTAYEEIIRNAKK